MQSIKGFSSKCFCIMMNFSPRYHNWSSPYELYRCISSHCYSDHAWWFARSVHLFRYAPHKRTNIEKISPERSLEIHLFLVPMQSYENIKKKCFKKRKVYVKPSTPIVTFCNGHPEISLHPSSLWECVWVTGFRGSL